MASETFRLTHSHLRWLLALLPGVLLVVTVGTAIVQGELEGSLSVYYGGPTHDVFVGVLIAVSVLLIAYQGSTEMEDYNFNGAGLYAAFVALVPTRLINSLESLRAALHASPEGLSPEEYVWSLRITLTLVAVLGSALMIRSLRGRGCSRRRPADSRPRLGFVALTLLTLIAFQVLAMWQLWVPPAGQVRMEGLRSVPLLNQIPFVGQLRVHDLAAIFLMCALAIGVWSHAWPIAAARQGEEPERSATAGLAVYRIVFVAMLAGPLLAWGAAALWAPGKMVILLEWWVIALFCLFWVLETLRQTRRVAISPPGTR